MKLKVMLPEQEEDEIDAVGGLSMLKSKQDAEGRK